MISNRSVPSASVIPELAYRDVAEARQYSVEDPAGHVWTFSQSIANIDPVSWGGTPIDIGR